MPVRDSLGRLLLVAAVVIWSPTAHASPLFELVGDTSGNGGMTARIASDGSAGAYFNPALLVDAPPGFYTGTFVLSEQIGVTVDGRATSPVCAAGECNVPEVGGRGPESFRHGNGEPISDPTVPTTWLQNGNEELEARPRQDGGSGQNLRAYQTVGLVTRILGDRITLGLHAMIPLSEFTTAEAFYNDEREQYFSNSLHPELYADRMTATSLAFGAGFRPHPKVALGATFTLSLANSAAVPVYVSNLNDLNTVLLDSDIGVQAAVAPHFGAVWSAMPGLQVAATVHTKQSFDIDTGFDFLLASGSEQGATLQFTHAYMPLTFAAAASYQLGKLSPLAANWTVQAETRWARWSQYRDRHSDRPSGAYAWSDTFSASAGTRYRAGTVLMGADVGYQPSPVPPQTGRTNYVDNDRIGVAVVTDYQFEMWGSRLTLGLNVTGSHLLSQHVTKTLPEVGVDDPELIRDEVPDDSIDVLGSPVPTREGLQTNNPGFPGYRSVGWLLGTGLRLAIQY